MHVCKNKCEKKKLLRKITLLLRWTCASQKALVMNAHHWKQKTGIQQVFLNIKNENYLN